MRIPDPQAIARQLGAFPNWTGGAESLCRAHTAPTFPAAIALVTEVARAAEELDHRPDIDVRCCTVRFRLSTPAVGGVTDLDLELARRIEEIIAGPCDAKPRGPDRAGTARLTQESSA